jgi:hypothetical protein
MLFALAVKRDAKETPHVKLVVVSAAVAGIGGVSSGEEAGDC